MLHCFTSLRAPENHSALSKPTAKFARQPLFIIKGRNVERCCFFEIQISVYAMPLQSKIYPNFLFTYFITSYVFRIGNQVGQILFLLPPPADLPYCFVTAARPFYLIISSVTPSLPWTMTFCQRIDTMNNFTLLFFLSVTGLEARVCDRPF